MTTFAHDNMFFGLSTDTKPASPLASWIFLETDTALSYTVVGGAWKLAGPVGVHRSTSATFISGTGTAGADGTAQTVVSGTVAANTMKQVGDRLRVRAYWRGDTGTPITGTTKIGPSGSEVSISDTTDIGGATFQANESWVHYVDNTHAAIIENEAGALGSLSAPSVAGFTWNADQVVLIAQNNVANNHIVVFALIIDTFPKGVA